VHIIVNNQVSFLGGVSSFSLFFRRSGEVAKEEPKREKPTPPPPPPLLAPKFHHQVAFTTDPRKSRSSPYCTDVAKALNAPIFHVNGDDVEAVVRACELAAEWRQAWKSDVVVDVVCYRRYGHNEIDEPMFTQPLMYKAIRKHRDPYKIYQDKLLKEGVVDEKAVDEISDNVTRHLHAEFERARDYKPEARDWLSSYWAGFHGPNQLSRIRNTGVTRDVLERVGAAVTRLPGTLSPHKQISRVYAARAAAIESGKGVDWALAEALAFGTLLSEGNHVRLSGQDVERGTFSHRHAVVHDQETGERYTPLAHVDDGQKPGQFTVSNSSLSEFGVLGFELGYALENPNALVLWEAQFGDFANGAQVIFDQFMSSGEAKWLRQNGLTVLLPHGYDGQGPEHSSARLERFLQMSDENPYVIPVSLTFWGDEREKREREREREGEREREREGERRFVFEFCFCFAVIRFTLSFFFPPPPPTTTRTHSTPRTQFLFQSLLGLF